MKFQRLHDLREDLIYPRNRLAKSSMSASVLTLITKQEAAVFPIEP